jgi:hypothetical protein
LEPEVLHTYPYGSPYCGGMQMDCLTG